MATSSVCDSNRYTLQFYYTAERPFQQSKIIKFCWFYTFSAPSPFAVQRHILPVPLERVHPRNIPQHAFEPYNVGGGQPCPPVYLKQRFLLHLFGVGGVIFLAGQVTEVCPYGQADRFQLLFRIAVFVDNRLQRQYFNFLIFQFHSVSPLYRRRVFRVVLIQSHIAVQQRRRAVYALFGRLVLDRNNIAVSVRLYARVGQTPLQNGIVVIDHLVRLQVRS